MDMKRILQAMDRASSKPVAGANEMSQFLRVVDEAAMYGAATTPPSPSGLTPAQQKLLAPYLETDPTDGSKYYDLPGIDTKEKGAIMGTTVKSPGYIAAIKQDQGKVIQQLLRQLDPKNQVKEPQVTTTPLSDEETAKVMATMQENSLDKFLSIVKKNDVKILNEGKSPHAVSLPVQMAMQHYQKQESKPRVTVSTTNGLGKYFHDVEQEFQENQTSKRQLINQYAGKIAERVLMKEGKQDPLEKIAKRKALQSIDSSLYKNYSEEVVNEKSKSEKQARTMAAAAHDPEFAKKVGIKTSVAKEFNKKDKGTALLSNAMKGKKKKVKENEVPGHSMGFNPTGGPGMGNYVVDETPLDFDKENPAASTIHSHQGVNPASIEARIMRARGQLKDLSERAQTNDLLTWENITRQFPELAMNMEQIRHGIDELARIRKQGGRRTANIPKHIGENNPIKEANAKKRSLKNSNPCWDGYKPVGTKKKNGRTVPNCVPKE